MDERREKWVCFEIDNDGEGERGRRVVVQYIGPYYTAEQAAEAAAAELHDAEARSEGYDCLACAFDATSSVIEVEIGVGQSPLRFRVRCSVKPEYRAHREEIFRIEKEEGGH